jgi:predicted Zn-dependent protease
MLKFRLFCLVIFLIFCSSGQGQGLQNYEPIRSKSPLPDRVTTSLKEQVETSKADFRRENGELTELEEEFLIGQNAVVNQLFKSGRIIFNDTISNYVQQISDYVYNQNQGVLDRKPDIYLVKSPLSTAYVFHFNKIFISIGLLAQVESEAELAYIIAHELVHIQKNHGLSRYRTKQKIISGSENFEHITNSYEAVVAKKLFSKDQEREADLKGLSYFENTVYTKKAVFRAFDVLQYAKYPFDNIPFEKEFFETDYLEFPDKLFLDKTQAIATGEQIEHEELRTHPNIQKRKRAIEKNIGNLTQTNQGVQFKVSEEAFNYIQKLARFEVCRLYLQKLDYAKAIYSAYTLIKDHTDNLYLKKVIAKALYNLTIYKNEDEAEHVLVDHEKIEGYSQQVHHFLEQMKPIDLNALAANYAWQLKKAHPDVELFDQLANKLLKTLIFTHDLSKNNFYDVPREKALAELKSQMNEKKEPTKYDKIEQEQLQKRANFRKFAFVPFFEDKNFNDKFDAFIREYNKEELDDPTEALEDKLADLGSDGEVEVTKEEKPENIQQIALMKPNYNVYVEKYQRKKDEIASYESRKWFFDMCLELSEKVGLESISLSPVYLDQQDEGKYNQMALIKEWRYEVSKHKDLPKVMISNENLIRNTIDRTGHRYVFWSGVTTQKRDNDKGFFNLVLWGMTGVGLPIGLFEWIEPKYKSYYYAYLIDLKDGDYEWAEKKNFEVRDSKDILQSYVYYTLNQIRNK